MSDRYNRYSGNLPSYLLGGIDYSSEDKIRTAKTKRPEVDVEKSSKLKYADFASLMIPQGKGTYEHAPTHTVWIKQGDQLIRVNDDDIVSAHKSLGHGKTHKAHYESARDIIEAISFDALSDKAAKSYEKKGKSPKKSKEIGDAVAGMVYWKHGPGKNKKHKKAQQEGDYVDTSNDPFNPTYMLDGQIFDGNEAAVEYLMSESHNMSEDEAEDYLMQLPEITNDNSNLMSDDGGFKQAQLDDQVQQASGDKILMSRQVRDTVMKIVIGAEEFDSIPAAMKHLMDNGMSRSDALQYVMKLPREWSDNNVTYSDEEATPMLKSACLRTVCQEVIDAFKDNPWETLVDIVDAGMKQDATLFDITEVVNDISDDTEICESAIDHVMKCLERHGKTDVKRKHAGKDIEDILESISSKTKKAQNKYDPQSFAYDMNARGIPYDAAIEEIQSRFGLNYFDAEQTVHNAYDIKKNNDALYSSDSFISDGVSNSQGVASNGSVDSSGEIVGIPTKDNRPNFVSAQDMKLDDAPNDDVLGSGPIDDTSEDIPSDTSTSIEPAGIDPKFDEYKINDSDGVIEYSFPNGKLVKVIEDGDDLYSVSFGDSDSDMDHSNGVTVKEVNQMLDAVMEDEESEMGSDFDAGTANITQAQLGQLINQLMNGGEIGTGFEPAGIIHIHVEDTTGGKPGKSKDKKEEKKEKSEDKKKSKDDDDEDEEFDDLSSLFSGADVVKEDKDEDDKDEEDNDDDDDKEVDDKMFESLFTDSKSSKKSRSDDDEED